ncbi:MAG: formate transporter FocA [Caldilineales bacterium]|nr:formate transporter FocA [Caldilineales bacterium]
MTNEFSFDALVPPEMATKAESIGVRKAHLRWPIMLMLSILAGAFIGLGAMFSTTVTAGGSDMPYGVVRLLAGSVFSLGLILVVVGGAELFTGNNLIVMAWADHKVSTWLLIKNWIIVYLGNFAGAIATAALVFISGQYLFGKASVGASALSTAAAKTGLEFVPAIALGMLCNVLVCLAVWMSFSARSTTDRILAIVPPIAAFVAAGFEHSIANMYFIPMGLFIKAFAPASFWATVGKLPADYPTITWERFFVGNLLPVTIGNIIGGAIMVGAVYWFIYLRAVHAAAPSAPPQPKPEAAPRPAR